MQGDRLQVQSARKRLYLIGVAESLMAVLCRSSLYVEAKWRGWKGREEKGTVGVVVMSTVAVATKRAGFAHGQWLRTRTQTTNKPGN